jgi:TolA-binding protein
VAETTSIQHAAPSVAARSAGKSNATAREAPSATAADWFALFRDGKYAASLSAARATGFERLLHELDAERLSALADAARFGGDARAATAALTALEQRFPGTNEAAQATFLLGRLRALSGDAATAIADFERYLQRYPTGTYATEAMGRLAELYSKRGNRAQAGAMARRYLERAPDGPYARLARSLTKP